MRRLDALVALADPRQREAIAAELARARARPEVLPPGRIVLVGHRAAGKSRLLPEIAVLVRRPAVDLDEAIARVAGEPVRAFFERDEPGFRRAEREAFLATPPDAVIAAGGGFLSLHDDLLEGSVAVLVPVSLETYRERLLADEGRPRLRPELSAEGEIEAVYREREKRHAAVPTWGLGRFLAAAARGLGGRPVRVVTLPPTQVGEPAVAFARSARARGAGLLELRTDLHRAEDVDPAALGDVLPLLVAERGTEASPAWLSEAQWLDQPLGPRAKDASLWSLHSAAPLSPDAVERTWAEAELPEGAWLKHVEPLGPPVEAGRLFETQRRLGERFGEERVTVLATGPLALPFRSLLARGNALEYLSFDATWSAAPGQRLLADAVREGAPKAGLRRGILGARVEGSRSPRVHRQPFDRIQLPEDAPVGELVDALKPFYAGFAVTSPFKKQIAAHVGAPFPAVNTLVRRARGWDAFNTDVEGAAELLRRLGDGPVTVLGDGGAAAALRVAAANTGRAASVLKRADASGPIRGLAIWTWPEHLEPPEGLTFERARVAVIAYGAPGRRVAEAIHRLGGTPVRLGAAWFVAQARGQRRLWEGGK